MELIPIECGHCNAKLKIKASPSRLPSEVKCPKCGKAIPMSKKPQTDAPPPSVPAPAPSAPTPMPPPVAAPIPAPASSSTAQLTPAPKPAPSATPATPKPAAPIVLGQLPDTSAGAMVGVKCPACQWQTKVSNSLVGKKIRCKQCSTVVLVSGSEPTSAPVETAPPPATSRIEVSQPSVSAPTPVAPPPAPAPVQPTPTPTPPPPPVPAVQAPLPPPVTPPAPAPEALRPLAATPAPTSSAPLDPSIPLTKDPSSRVSPGTTVLIGEIADLKIKLSTAQRESSESLTRATEAEKRYQAAEKHAQETEKALHDLAGKVAVENIAATRKIAELEAKIAELQQRLRTMAGDYQAELDFIEKRIAALREKLSKFEQ